MPEAVKVNLRGRRQRFIRRKTLNTIYGKLDCGEISTDEAWDEIQQLDRERESQFAHFLRVLAS